MKTVGLPRMHKEKGERRDFLPQLVSFITRLGASKIVLEHGYGEGVGCEMAEYLAASPVAVEGSYEECLAQDLVIVIRCPAEDALARLRPGAILLSMLHYPTRPRRVSLLQRLGVHGVSLDGVHDESGRRMVENLAAVGWNGVRAAFEQLQLARPDFESTGRPPLRVTVLGSGAVGGHAVRAASRYGDAGLRNRLAERGVPGVEVRVLDYDLTGHAAYMREVLAQTDLLVDATQRPDATRFVIPNAWIGHLPGHAVLLDLSVDPYDFTVNPPEVKGIEGMPEGTLDQFVFKPDDPVYDRLDSRVATTHRRVALSCYSWPGVDPRPCMELYGAQIEPLVRVLIDKPLDLMDVQRGPYFERAVARAEANRWAATKRR